MNKITVPLRPPRNILVPLARARRAGAFKTGDRRQAEKRELRKEIE